MNTDTGEIMTPQQMADIRAAFEKLPPEEQAKADLSKYKEMQIPPTLAQIRKRPPRVGRNDLCPCGSGWKFKKCCYTGVARKAVEKEKAK